MAGASAADVVRGIDRLWREHGAWLSSVDLNPLVVTDDAVVAVDACAVGQDDTNRADRPENRTP